MSLLDEARLVQVENRGPQCGVAALGPELVAEVNEALSDERIYATTVAVILKRRGLDLPSAVIQRHRRRGRQGGCSCPS